jgi:hypothetical protein
MPAKKSTGNLQLPKNCLMLVFDMSSGSDEKYDAESALCGGAMRYAIAEYISTLNKFIEYPGNSEYSKYLERQVKINPKVVEGLILAREWLLEELSYGKLQGILNE